MGQQISSAFAVKDKGKQPAPQQGDQSDSYDEFFGPRRWFMFDACHAYEHPVVGSLCAPQHGKFLDLGDAFSVPQSTLLGMRDRHLALSLLFLCILSRPCWANLRVCICLVLL